MQNDKKMFTSSELRYLIVGGSNLRMRNPKPCEWLSDKQWVAIEELASTIGVFKSIDVNFDKDSANWYNVIKSQTPYIASKEVWPKEWLNTLSIFHRMMIVRILRPDCLIYAF